MEATASRCYEKFPKIFLQLYIPILPLNNLKREFKISMHNLKINIFPRLPFHPPITVPQRIKFVSETGSAGRESESERVWKSRVRSRDANASDGSFPLFAAHFCRRAPPSRFYRGPETVHRRCRRYAGRIELNGAKGGEAGYTCLENVSRR